MSEEWKTCIENYEVSNEGRFRRKLLTGGYSYFKGSIQNKGYLYFQINRGGKRINYLIHQEVARLFLGERPEGLVVDHKDRNKLNNNVSNLHYITQRENTFNRDGIHSHIPQNTPNRRNLLLKEYQEKNKEVIKQRKKEYYEKNKSIILEKEKAIKHTINCSKCNVERTISKSMFNMIKRKGLESNICKRCSAINNLGTFINKGSDKQ